MSLSYWQRFQEAFCKRSRRREVALKGEVEALKRNTDLYIADNVKMMKQVVALKAENEALKKHNEIMKDSLAAAQAEVERLIQVTTREDELFRRRSQGAKDGWESRRAKQRKEEE